MTIKQWQGYLVKYNDVSVKKELCCEHNLKFQHIKIAQVNHEVAVKMYLSQFSLFGISFTAHEIWKYRCKIRSQ